MTELARPSELLSTLEESAVLANFDAFLNQFKGLESPDDRAVAFALLSTIAKRSGDMAAEIRAVLMPQLQERFNSGQAALLYCGTGESEEAVRLTISQRTTLSFDPEETAKALREHDIALSRAGKVTYDVDVPGITEVLEQHGVPVEAYITPVLAPDKKKIEALVSAGVLPAESLTKAVTAKATLAVRKKFGTRLQFALGVSAEDGE